MRHLTYIYRGQGDPERISLEIDQDRRVFSRGGASEAARITRLPDGRFSLLFENGRQICGRVLPAGRGDVEVVTGSSRIRIPLAEPLRDRLAHAAAGAAGEEEEEEVRALMPGRVLEIGVAAGDRLEAGAILLVLEAMKMQNEIRTARGGTVIRVEVEPGRAVDGGALLVVLRSEAE
jgi:biotin carboxyl carrier protein